MSASRQPRLLRHPLTLLLAWLAPHMRAAAARNAGLVPRFNLISAHLHKRTFEALRSQALSERVERELIPIWNVDAALRHETDETERESVRSALRSPLQLALASLRWPRGTDTRSGWERIRAAIATIEQVFSVRWAYWFYVTAPHWPLRDSPLVIVVFECNADMLSSIAADERPFLALVAHVGPPQGAPQASYSVLRMADLSNVDAGKHWQPPTTSLAQLQLLTIGWLPPTLFQGMEEPTWRYRPLDDNTALVPLITIDAEALDAAHEGEELDEGDPPI